MTDQPQPPKPSPGQPLSGAPGEVLDQASDLARENPEQARELIDRVEDIIDSRTGGRFSGAVDQAGEWAEGQLGLPGENPAPEPDAPTTPTTPEAPSSPETPSTPEPPSSPEAPTTPSAPEPPSAPETPTTPGTDPQP